MGANHSNIKHQELKKLSYQVKVTAYIRGGAKDAFFNDCIKKGISESAMFNEILNRHYKY